MLFNSFWHGREIPLYAAACMASFVKAGHEYHIYAYNLNLKVPWGVKVRDARIVLSEDQLFFDVKHDGSLGNVASFSDLFRYTLLYKLGGWWVDTDVLLVGNDLPDSKLFFGWEDERCINGAILRAPANHMLVKQLELRARQIGRRPTQGAIGPPLVTEVIHELGLTSLATPQTKAYPLSYNEYYKAVTAKHTAEVYQTIKAGAFLHLWNEMFSIENCDLLYSPEKSSFFDRILKQNLSTIQYSVIRGRRLKRVMFGE